MISRDAGSEISLIERVSSILRATESITGLSLFLVDRNSGITVRSRRRYFCRGFARRVCPEFTPNCPQVERCISSVFEDDKAAGLRFLEPLYLREIVVPVEYGDGLFIVSGASARNADQLEQTIDALISMGCTIPREELQDAVVASLPVIEDCGQVGVVEVVNVAAFLVKAVYEACERSRCLKAIERMETAARALLIEPANYTGENPLNSMMKIASELLVAAGGDACCLWARDEQKGRMFGAISSGLSENQVLKLPTLSADTSFPGLVATRKESCILSELSRLEGRDFDGLQSFLRDCGFQSLVSVPICSGCLVPAVIMVLGRTENSFTPADSRLLETVGPYAWEGFQKAESSRFAAAVGELSKELNTARNKVEFYNQLADRIRYWLGAAGCSMFARKEGCDELTLVGTTGIVGDPTGSSYKIGQGLTGWVFKNSKTLRVYNCEDEKELQEIAPDLKWSGHVREKGQNRLEFGATRSVIACPVALEGKTLGVLRVCIASSSRPVFSREDEILLECLSRDLAAHWDRSAKALEAQRVSEDTRAILHDIFEVHQAVVALSQAVQEKDDGIGGVVSLAFHRIKARYPAWRWMNLRIPDLAHRQLKFFGVDGAEQVISTTVFPLILGNSIGADCFLQKVSIHCPDISAEPRYKCPFDKLGAKSCFNIPLVVSGQPIGVLSVDSIHLNDFDERGRHYLEMLAAQLATAFTLASSISALRRADREKQAHLEAMAHQLIAPLAAIRLHCENILQNRTTAERARIALQSLEAQSRIAAYTASNFGIFAGLLVGRSMDGKIRSTPQDIVGQLIDVARDYQPMAWNDGKNICVTVRGEHAELKKSSNSVRNSILVKYDHPSFVQVLVNVVENAVKYSDPYTNINIDVTETDTSVRIDITSVGIPLSPEDVERIFEKEIRTAAARQKYPPGTGIGLPIARAIMAAHNGTIVAQPTDEKKSTTFTIELPR